MQSLKSSHLRDTRHPFSLKHGTSKRRVKGLNNKHTRKREERTWRASITRWKASRGTWVLNIKKRKGRKHAFSGALPTLRRSFFLAPLRVQNFFCFLTIFFRNLTLTQTRFTRPNNNRGSGIFKTAATYVLRKEKRLLTTGQITRYYKSERRERAKIILFFFFQFLSNGTPSFFLLGGA